MTKHHVAEILEELRKREKEMGIEPDWTVDALMKSETLEAHYTSITTEFIIRMLGLGICSDTMVRSPLTLLHILGFRAPSLESSA